MIDLKDLRDNPDKYRKGASDKHSPIDIDALLDLDEQVRSAQTDLQQLVASRNQLAKQIGPLMGKMKKASDAEKQAIQGEVELLKKQAEQGKAEEAALSDKVRGLELQREALWLQVPQPADPDVPVGAGSDDNIELRVWNPVGERAFDASASFEDNRGFKPKSHMELGQALGLFEFERGVKMAGSRSYVLTGDGMRLHNAVLQYAFNFMVNDHGFKAMSVPVLVKEECMVGTGFFPGGKDQAYKINNNDHRLKIGVDTPNGRVVFDGLKKALAAVEEPNSGVTMEAVKNSLGAELQELLQGEGYLTGTGEVGLMGLHQDEILDEDTLPRCYTTVSTCFRREAGAAGKDTAGLYRIHQFDKVEQVVICKADEQESRDWHQKMIGYVEALLQNLGLPYRLLQCCTGDLGQKNADMIDVECWMPSRESYGETHSASRLYDFQTRRLNLRYKATDENGKKKTTFCHSLNNTVAASPRILIPILEMYQNEDGSVTVPKALRPYMGGQETIR
jgi:seryl-tRNA synthetase